MRLLEREAQLASLLQYAEEARAGNGRLVLLAGEAGVGKSSLLDELEQRLADARWAGGACDGLFTPRPLAPLVDIGSELGGELGDLLREGAPPERLSAALLDDLMTADRPTVLAIEDVHWADEATLDLLRFLGRRIRRTRALAVVTYRDDGLAADDQLRVTVGELSAHQSTRRMALPPLTEQAVATLAEGTGLRADELHRVTGGNPFYVSEVVQTTGGDLPLSVRDAVLARVAGLAPEARETLDVASLIGARMRPELLTTVTEAAPTTLDALVACGVLVGEDGQLRFRHEIARMAVQATVPPHRAAAAHRQILDALLCAGSTDEARLAHHAEGARDRAAVLVHASAAGRRASELGSHREAAVQFRRAVSAADAEHAPTVTRAELYAALADELALIDQWEGSADIRSKALELWCEVGDPRREGDNLRKLSRTMWRLCRGDGAEVTAVAAVAAVEREGPCPELAWVYANLANHRMNRGEFDEAVRVARQAREVAEPLGLDDVLSDALNTEACSSASLGAVWSPLLHRALEVAKGSGHDEQAGRAFANLYALYVDSSRLVEGEGVYVEGLDYCIEHDIGTFTTCLLGCRTIALEKLGRWDESVAMASDLLQQGGPSPVNRLNPLLSIAKVLLRRGDPAGRGWLDEASAMAETLREPEWIVQTGLAQAEAAWLEGRADDGLRMLADIEPLGPSSSAHASSAIAAWQHRIGGLRSDRRGLAEPYASEVAGDAERAVRLWDDRGLPYEAALAGLASTDEDVLRDALARLDALGAAPAARIARQVMRGRGVKQVPAGARRTTKANPAGLTRREQEVLEHLCEGLTNDEIAARLFLSVKTVDHHVSAVLAKLGVPSRKLAATEAVRRGLVRSTT